MSELRFYKILLWANALLPLALLGWDARNSMLGVNPIEYFLRTTGVLTLVFLLVTLAVTPLRKVFGWNQLIKYRRILGLFAFFYGLIHLTTYLIFDRGGDISGTVQDVIQRPFIAFGMGAFLLMVPLAVTSTNSMIKKLGGKRWQKLHRLIYISGIAGVVHFWMIVKSDVFYPAIFAGALAVFLGFRLVAKYFANQPKRSNAN
jgi:methionine sulfoxide reductase heme-binding subunit